MKILVTGAKGMVGTALVNNLKNIRDGKNKTRPNIVVDEIYEYDIDSTPEELDKPEWRVQFENRPKEIVPENVIIAVCRAHGETIDKIRREVINPNGELKYLHVKDTDPLFCTLLLRLADILDFDDSRAPSILFSYAGRSLKSIEEWKKHESSLGFIFSSKPSSDNLHYGASFTDPKIERAVHVFLDWVDEELINSRSLLPLTCSRWNQFPIPFQVERNEIERIGYDYGDFRITMDQDRIMDLLIGENLYSDRSVFVRELLQNSVDATLLRAEMDLSFANKINTDEARIDIWEWWDNNGDLWFRIDDCGIGMTKGMLERYFLKAGNSYYNSQELRRDLNGKSYSSISRFGIGFLSCFLCGIDAYVSTTYCNPEKNIREAMCNSDSVYDNKNYGLRLDVVGVNGYYTLRNQAINDNRPAPLPAPPITAPHPNANYEKDGYRTLPGTSIAIRLDAGRLGSCSLLDVAKQWTCFPHMPIYYNGERLCMTQNELIDLAKEECGSNEYELTDDEKIKFDAILPEFKGDYPRIRETIELFEADHIAGLSKQKIILLETKVLISEEKRLYRNGWGYKVTGRSYLCKPGITIYGAGENSEDIILSFQHRDNRSLFKIISNNVFLSTMLYGWKGIFVYQDRLSLYNYSPTILVIDEDEARPDSKVNRSYWISVPLNTVLTTVSWLEKNYSYIDYSNHFGDLSRVTLKEWRNIISQDYLKWVNMESWSKFINFKQSFEKSLTFDGIYPNELNEFGLESSLFYCINRGSNDIRYVFLAYLQLRYKMIINYFNQTISFCELEADENLKIFDLFPLMPFAYGETDKDSSILCPAKANCRLSITVNHPFIKWLLINAEKLHKNYPIQFEQIINALKYFDSENLITAIDQIVEQLSKISMRYGIDFSTCPKLKINDFWNP